MESSDCVKRCVSASEMLLHRDDDWIYASKKSPCRRTLSVTSGTSLSPILFWKRKCLMRATSGGFHFHSNCTLNIQLFRRASITMYVSVCVVVCVCKASLRVSAHAGKSILFCMKFSNVNDSWFTSLALHWHSYPEWRFYTISAAIKQVNICDSHAKRRPCGKEKTNYYWCKEDVFNVTPRGNTVRMIGVLCLKIKPIHFNMQYIFSEDP